MVYFGKYIFINLDWEKTLNKKDFSWNLNSNKVDLKMNSREVAFR